MVPDAALPLPVPRSLELADLPALAAAAGGGDPAAFEAIVRRYQRRVYGLAVHHLHDAHEAQDLAQEIFVRLYRNFDRFDPGRPFEPWFWRLAANARTAPVPRCGAGAGARLACARIARNHRARGGG